MAFRCCNMKKGINLKMFTLPALVLVLILLAEWMDSRALLPFPAALLPLAVGGGLVCYDTFRIILKSRHVTAGLLVVLALMGSVFTGEFSEGAEVAFMMLLAEAIEDFSMEYSLNHMQKMMDHIPNAALRQKVSTTGSGGHTDRLADRFSEYFLPLVLAIGLVTWFITRDIHRVMTIFVIACPCTLMLSSPIAVLTCIGTAARKGILIANGELVEKLGSAHTVSGPENGMYTTDVGLTIGTKQAADVILLKDDGHSLHNALQLTRRARRIILENILIFALFMNLLGIILSSLGLLTMVSGAFWHNLSMICVILNSLRLLTTI